eukprot:g9668.t1
MLNFDQRLVRASLCCPELAAHSVGDFGRTQTPEDNVQRAERWDHRVPRGGGYAKLPQLLIGQSILIVVVFAKSCKIPPRSQLNHTIKLGETLVPPNPWTGSLQLRGFAHQPEAFFAGLERSSGHLQWIGYSKHVKR